MYQAVFVSVVGVVLVIKIVFMVASIWFTLKYENQENRRGSVVSVATSTLSFGSFDQHSESSLGEHSGGSCGEHSKGNFGEYSRRNSAEHSRESFGEYSGGIFGEPSQGSFRKFSDGDFGELRLQNIAEQTDGSSGPPSIEYHTRSSNPHVLFFDAIIHMESSSNSNAFCEDSFV